MPLLRNDGEFIVYVLQHELPGGGWARSSLDHFRFADSSYDPKTGYTGVRHEFSATGDCWQRTGLCGTFDREIGLKGLSEISRANPGLKFGLFAFAVSQRATEVATMTLPTEPVPA